MILAKWSLILAGVGGDTDEVSDDIEYVGEGVSGGKLNEGCTYNVNNTHPLC